MNKTSKRLIVSIYGTLLTLGYVLTPAYALDECGQGPQVTCSGNYSASGVTYNFDTDFVFRTPSVPPLITGVGGLTLGGSNGANLDFESLGTIIAPGGVHIEMDAGDINMRFRGLMPSGQLTIRTAGTATIDLAPLNPSGINGVRIGDTSAVAGGQSSLNIGAGRLVGFVNLESHPGGSWAVVNGGYIGSSLVTPTQDAVAFASAGQGSIRIDNSLRRGRIVGTLDMSANDGDVLLVNDNSAVKESGGGWTSWGTSGFGGGRVQILNGPRGVISTIGASTFDFSHSLDSEIVNEGVIRIGSPGQGAPSESDLRLQGLRTFRNSGRIVMGVGVEAILESNRRLDARLIFEGTDYIGEPGAQIEMDTGLSDAMQTDCGSVVASDCVLFDGGSTSGVTTLLVRDRYPSIENASFNEGIVLIEGASGADHFELDPASQYFVQHSSAGASLQKGLIAYRLAYDPLEQHHKLVGTLADEAFQSSIYVTTLQNVWRVTTESWFDREHTPRAGLDNGLTAGGIWGGLTLSRGSRELQGRVNVSSGDVGFNADYDEQVAHLAIGFDVLRGETEASVWNIGLTGGYVHSETRFDATQQKSSLAGFAGGVYGEIQTGDLSVNAMVNLNVLTQSIEAANLGLGEHYQLRTTAETLGVRVDSGWKIALSPTIWVQPIVSLSFVTSTLDDIELDRGGHSLAFGHDASTRAGAGLRSVIDTRLAGSKARFTLTGRWWNEFSAENTSSVRIAAADDQVALEDDFGGRFLEVGSTLEVTDDSGALSGELMLQGTFGDDYYTMTGGLGVTYRW
jgi:uncharacterized protein YhjY with autotransporter beta-barrel domain